MRRELVLQAAARWKLVRHGSWQILASHRVRLDYLKRLGYHLNLVEFPIIHQLLESSCKSILVLWEIDQIEMIS